LKELSIKLASRAPQMGGGGGEFGPGIQEPGYFRARGLIKMIL